MTTQHANDATVTVTTQEVLPTFGLAFVVDDAKTIWGITRSAEGPGLQMLQRGSRLQVSLERHHGYSLVRSYRLLD